MMTTSPTPSPTLWRTCRVLANRSRLKIFALLARESPQTVSAVALRLGLALPVASQYLRALEARGLLSARRVGRRVEYRVKASTAGGLELVEALRRTLKRNEAAIESVFHLCTAFTHARRIEIFRSLNAASKTTVELKGATRISWLALRRHLRKLDTRGFVMSEQRTYSARIPSDAVGRALARAAVA